jgi:hypothetical protein
MAPFNTSLAASNEQLAALGLTNMLPPEGTPEAGSEQDYANELFDFNKFLIIGKQLHSDWASEIAQTEENRELRKFECDPEALRQSKAIGEDETYVADRVIDNNIRREQPASLNFITASRNVVTFTRKDNMSANERLEELFTRGAKYVGWEMPFIKETDGASCHGWDSVEVIYDETKPLGFAIEHIGHDKLFFARGSKDLNAEEIVLREYDLTCSQLRSYVKSIGFSPEVVDSILSDKQSPTKRFTNNRIYKVYMKIDNVVYIAWASFDGKSKDWLKAPEKLRLGIKHKEVTQVPVPPDAPPEVALMIAASPTVTTWVDDDISVFPIFLLVRDQDEQQEITAHLGRAHIDLPAQEASTTLWTAQTNQAVRSSYVMWAADREDGGSGGSIKQTQMKLGNGMVIDKPLRQFKIDEPTGGMLKVVQALKMQNIEQAGQQLQATLSKGPSARTTGEEIQTAKEQQSQLSMINLLLLSMHIRDVYSFGWKITQSLYLQGIIWQNTGLTPEEVAAEYELRAGGDTDVIQRAEKLNRMQAFWPVVAQTPAASSFLISMLQLAFPSECAPWVEALKGQDPRLVAAMLSDLLVATLTPEEVAGLPPEQQQLMQQAIMQAQQYKTQLAMPSSPKNDNQPSGGPVREDNKPSSQNQPPTQ